MKVFNLVGTSGKATVVEENGVSRLFSYDTNVATYNHNSNTMTVNGWYSLTTGKHINKFLEFYGFEPCTKKELIKVYNLTENI